ncbi:MAG TPA: cytochrome c [Urbifossiella sp.]|nr:cytochrome c [Urbifossiella sp.]
MATMMEQIHTVNPSPEIPAESAGVPAAEPAKSYGLPMWQRVAIIGLPVALVLIAWVVPATALLNFQGEPTAAVDPPQPPPSGSALYARHCAHCHGSQGDGAGSTAANLWPRPRNFREGRFRLVTTQNGIPSDNDLLTVLRNGIPGSSMPAFGHLGDSELLALIEQVRNLMLAGAMERLQQLAEQGDIEPHEVYPKAADRCAPGPVLAVPKEFPPPTPASLARGREVYAKSCASCHGPAGRGDGPQVKQLINTDGSQARPRDLTLGRFKGGADPAQVYARIMLGLPGSPMPASNLLPQEDILHLINHVLSLSQPGAAAVAHTPNGPIAPSGSIP